MARTRDTLRCSFCGKDHGAVTHLIAGPGVFICDACVALCNEIIGEGPPSAVAGLPRPSLPERALSIVRILHPAGAS